MVHGNPETKEAIFDLGDGDRRAAADTECREFCAAGNGFGGFLDIFLLQLLFDGGNRAADFLKDGPPERWALKIGADMGRQFKIDPADRQCLGQPHLEFANAAAADRAAETRHCWLAHARPVSQFGIA